MERETIEDLVGELENIKAIIQNLNTQYVLNLMNTEQKSKETSLLREINAAAKAITRIGKKIELLHHDYMHPASRIFN